MVMWRLLALVHGAFSTWDRQLLRQDEHLSLR